MGDIFTLVVTILLTLWVWVSALSMLCLIYDPDLEPVQRWGQTAIILMIPFVGAIIVLRLVNDHSPEVIHKFYIPWPFKRWVQNKKLPDKRCSSFSGYDPLPGAQNDSFSGGSEGGGNGGD